MNKLLFKLTRNWLDLLMWGLITLLWGTMFYLTPEQLDDLVFSNFYRDFNGGSYKFDWGAWMRFYDEIRSYDNGRFAQLFTPASTIWFPLNVIFPWCTGAAVATIAYLSTRFITGKNPRWSAYALIWLGLSILLPWRDNLFVRAFALNYVWSALLSLIAIYVVYYRSVRRLNWWQNVLGVLMLIIAAGWHEGFYVPVAAALCVKCVLDKKWHNPITILFIIIYIISGLAVTLSPGIIGRADKEMSQISLGLSAGQLVDYITAAFLFVGLIILLSSSRGRKKLKRLDETTLLAVFVVAAAVGCAISLVVVYRNRVMFFPTICSIISIGIILRDYWLSLSTKIQNAIGVVSLLIAVTIISTAIYYQNRVKEEYTRILEEMDKSENCTIFTEILGDKLYPFYTLRYPSQEMWRNAFTQMGIRNKYGKDFFAVVPKELEDFDENKSVQLKGHDKIYLHRSRIVIDPACRQDLHYEKNKRFQYFRLRGQKADSTWITIGSVKSIYFITTAGDTMIYCVYPQKYDISNLVSLEIVEK